MPCLHQNTRVTQCDLPFSSCCNSKFLILAPGLPAALVTPSHTDTWLPSNLLSACSSSQMLWGSPRQSPLDYIPAYGVQIPSFALCFSDSQTTPPILSPPLSYHTWSISSQRLCVFSFLLTCTTLSEVVSGSLVQVTRYYDDSTNGEM